LQTLSDNGQVRRLAAVLVADAVGYSGLMRVAEDATHELYKADIVMLFVPAITRFRGRIVKTTGDGLLAEFSSIVDCVRCAVDLQKLACERRGKPSEINHLTYRIGINVGDIIAEGDDIYGDGVNIAARLQTLAEPGGIALSAEAYKHVSGKLDASFEDLGDQEIKSIKEPLRVFRINFDNQTAAVQKNVANSRAKSVVAPSILVLPFGVAGRSTKTDYFSDGITSDIITGLSKFSELLVIASHTAFSLRGKPLSVPELGQQLGVRYLVEGTVQRTKEKIRISVQLVETASCRQLWAERYERPAPEIFKLQDEIVETIVGTLIARLDRSENRRILHKEPNDLETYDLYLKGRAAWREWTRQSNLLAQQHFRSTIELDPNFAPAYGHLSYTIVQAWLSGWDSSSEQLQHARELARKAVALEPENFENHWCLAFAQLFSREFDLAMATFDNALRMNPHSTGLLIDMADALVFVGRPEEAIAYLERAMRMNPISSDSLLWTLGIALYHAGQLQQSRAALEKIVNAPNLARRHLAAVYVRLGDIEKAKKIAEEFLLEDSEYTLEREKLWPYRNPAMLEAFVNDLHMAGLPGKYHGVF
jgi:adenylate cyclase